ncbi:MAG: CPBP family intramembrane metalloprotease [Chitinophagaceae bacterium]|nr:MAG: CPBP family intramembrane metalloprotease [Chitinophagaceae bacterium]
MQYKSVKGFTGFGQLGILIVFIGGGLILTGIAQLMIGMQMVPDDVPAEKLPAVLENLLMQPENIAYARLTQVLGTFLLLCVPAVLFSWVVNGTNSHWLGFSRHFNGIQLLLGFAIIFTANLLAAPFADLSKTIVANFPELDAVAKQIELTYDKQVKVLSHLGSWSEFFMAVVIMAFVPAMFEEIFFRGAVQNLLEKWWKNPWVAIIFTSLLFSLIHMSVYLFLSRAILGFALGLMFYVTKNIWINIFAHFINNAIAMAQLFYLTLQEKEIKVDELDPKLPWWLAVITLIILIGLFIILKRVSLKNRERILAKEAALFARRDIDDPFPKFH